MIEVNRTFFRRSADTLYSKTGIDNISVGNVLVTGIKLSTSYEVKMSGSDLVFVDNTGSPVIKTVSFNTDEINGGSY